MITFNDSDYNEDVQKWTKDLIEDCKDELDRLGVTHHKNSPNRTPLRKALKARYYSRFGAINRVGIVMPRSSVFLHKGVSRGHSIKNPRTPKQWFNPVVKRNLPELKRVLAKHSANFVVNHIFIK